MAFFDFFWKKAKELADTSAQNTVRGIGGHLEETNGYFAELSERLRRIETKQKETSLQLDEIDNFLQSGGTENSLVDALAALFDIIGDFYYYAAREEQGESSPLLEQAGMMWSAAKNAMETAGLEIIDAANVVFDFRLHSADSAEQDNSLPNGYVIRTLKHGYIYKDEVIRRALVVVNKKEGIF
ncbi:MAG: nucleotide exchange factor GrpE [Treponema sp.]|nr:nucleotide exchange factor GrpE [Treponema sp.]